MVQERPDSKYYLTFQIFFLSCFIAITCVHFTAGQFCNQSSLINGDLSHGCPGDETGDEMVDERGMWVEPADQRIVRAAVIGAPNAGKSTLINQLLGHKVQCPHAVTLW